MELSDYATSAFNTNKTLIHQIPSAKQVVQSALNRGARNGYEALIYRDYQIQSIAKEKGRVLVLLNDYRECIDRSRYLPHAMPSLLSGLLEAGVKKDSVLRVFILPEDAFDLTPELISNKNDSVSMVEGYVRDLKVHPTIFEVSTDSAVVANESSFSDEPFGLESNLGDSAYFINLLNRLYQYEITDRLLVGTVFLSLPLAGGISAAYDTAMAEPMDVDYGEYSRKSNF